jgi:UDP-galactopyranose mutase
MYDFLVVGAGLFGAAFARLATDAGYKCLVIDKRSHIGGNCFTRKSGPIDIHEYGPHIFHTSNEIVWRFVNRFASFNNFVYSPKSMSNGKLYSLPFSMNTFYEIWGVTSPEQARQKIEEQKWRGPVENLEQQALALVGEDIYYTLIKGYTEKQWGKRAHELPAFIIKRLPLRFTFDSNYFNDKYQGIPCNGYTEMITAMLNGIPVQLDVDFLENKTFWREQARFIVYTGCIDEYFDCQFGGLEYRSLRFEHRTLSIENYQGNAGINYADREVQYSRSIEHKHFNGAQCDHTVITREFPCAHEKGKTPYYPVNTLDNQAMFCKYKDRSLTEANVLFGGRLAEYKYMDMHVVIENAINKWNGWLKAQGRGKL